MKTRTVFMGTPEFGRAILETLINEDDLEVIAAVTQPDKLVGRKQQIVYSPVKQFALENGISVLQPIRIRSEYQEILDLQPDLIVTCAYGQIIPEELLNCPPLGCVNVHASLLPALRGGAPIQHAIIDGYEETGITIMEMDKKMDAGAIISQQNCPIEETDTYGSLHDRLITIATQLLHETLPAVINRTYQPIPQDEEKVTLGFNIRKEEEHIDLNRGYQGVYDQIRGLIPAPCGYLIVQGKKLKIWEVRKGESAADMVTGTIIAEKKQLGLVVDERILWIDSLQPEGKSRMNAADYLNGAGRGINGMIAE
ncbi:MAG: methionyl-tRNA formyltransferase [Erysipelotrichaceae bacterium]|nr:methionyl-tRNA formyltransferase [Erysipelotrichaceae bacterium]